MTEVPTAGTNKGELPPGDGSPVNVPTDRATNIAAGWAQGAVLSRGVFEGAIRPPLVASDSEDSTMDGADGAIIVSHSCDLAHADHAAEPFVELVAFRRTAGAPGKHYRYGANPRILEFEYAGATLRCESRDRWAVSRPWLFDRRHLIESKLEGETLALVVEWITRRYKRLELPESFAARLKVTKIRECLIDARECVAALYIRLDPWAEVGADEPYDVDILIVLDDRVDVSNPAHSEATYKLMHRLLAELTGAPGVTVKGAPQWEGAGRRPGDGNIVAATQRFVKRRSEIPINRLDGFVPFHPGSLNR